MANLINLNLDYNKLTGASACILGMDPDWAQTQTVAPTNLQALVQSTSSIQVCWTPILYTADGGYYEVSYATNAAGPFTVHGNTSSKTSSCYSVTGLMAAQLTTSEFALDPTQLGSGVSAKRSLERVQ